MVGLDVFSAARCDARLAAALGCIADADWDARLRKKPPAGGRRDCGLSDESSE